MKIEEQVLTIEQAKHLKELGLDMSDAAIVSYFCVGESGKKDRIVTCLSNEITEACYATSDYIYRYTLQEMIGKLPYGFEYFSLSYKDDCIGYYDSCGICYKKVYFLNDPLKAAYDVLCWVIENGYLKEEKK